MVDVGGTVKIPGFGPQKKKTVMLVGSGVILVAGVAYWRAKKARDAAAATVTTATDSSAIDPATGYAYGSTDDATALAAMSAYQNPTDYGGGGGSSSNGSTTVVGPVTYTTNSQWENAAVDYLSNTIGMTPSTVSSALSKYISGLDTNDAEKSIIEQAIASVGPAPVAGANGYPPSIRHTATGTGGGAVPVIADGYYKGNPSGIVYKVAGGARWRVSAATLPKVKTTLHPITDTTIGKLPLRGIV